MEEFDLILQKSGELFLKYGIKSVTMDDVSRELAISKKTLYLYVKDKSELVEKIIIRMMEGHLNEMKVIQASGLNAIEELIALNVFFMKMLKMHNPSMKYDLRKYYPEIDGRLINNRREVTLAMMLQNLQKGIAEGLYRKELNVDFIARVDLARYESAFESEIFTKEEIITGKYILELLEYHVRGIVNENGLKMWNEKSKTIKNIL